MVEIWHGRKLLVEGYEDMRVIPELIEANGIPWGESKDEAVVEIKSLGGIENLLDSSEIYTQLQISRLSALGLIVDADEEPIARWEQVRNACLPTITDFPEDLPETGLIHQTSFGVKFGVWMMPDNQMAGMLETFLAYLIPDEDDDLWDYAREAVLEAKNLGAKFKPNHTDKANIHTWLSWQNPPGRQLHNAIMEKILAPQHPQAQVFIDWFKNLYDL